MSFTEPTIIQSGTLLIITLLPPAHAGLTYWETFQKSFQRGQAAEPSLNLESGTQVTGTAKRLAEDYVYKKHILAA